MSREEAIELLRKDSGSHFDPRIVDLFVEHLPRFEAEIVARGLIDQIHVSAPGGLIAPAEDQAAQTRENRSFGAYDKIRNAHREVYALRDRRTFVASLELDNTRALLVDKVGHIGLRYLRVIHDRSKVMPPRPPLVTGLNADLLNERTVASRRGLRLCRQTGTIHDPPGWIHVREFPAAGYLRWHHYHFSRTIYCWARFDILESP